MRDLITQTAFSFDEREHVWAEVALAAIRWGEWQRFESWVREALAATETADDDELRARLVAFRRSRGLIAGEDYLRWLEDRGLRQSDVRAHLGREAAVAVSGPARHPPDANELAAAVRADAILSGRLHGWAERLIRCLAAARALAADGEDPRAAASEDVDEVVAGARAAAASGLDALAPDRLHALARDVVALDLAHAAFAARITTGERLARCLAAHRLDWQRLSWDEAVFAREGAAREAALWVREDGTSLGEVGPRAGAACATRTALQCEADDLGPLLVAAVPGELVGPLANADSWQLVQLRERTAPALDDATLRARASEEVLADALERHVAGRVRWHGDI